MVTTRSHAQVESPKTVVNEDRSLASKSNAARSRRSSDAQATVLIVAAAILLRLLVGLHPYSGMGDAPKFGDYEAQRHWMELTLHTPVSDWYRATPDNNLSYWGLDYPPLTAYQSWLYGKVLSQFDTAAFALHESCGYETPWSKLLLRWSVLFSDLIVFIPAVLLCARAFYPTRPEAQRAMLAAALLQPANILVDHGHFQYNNISLGLTAAAAGAIACRRRLIGSALFALALNHKQMGLYWAPAFFAHLLGWALQQRGAARKVAAVAKLGAVVAATFAVCWAPYLTSPAAALEVLQRLAPLKRGLYEDYVANFWCSTHFVVPWKRLFSQAAMIRLCLAATLAGLVPAMLQQIRKSSSKGLLLCMANSAMVFFLFSYQVHEKSILMPLLPVTLLAPELRLARWLPAAAVISMAPLLLRDGLGPAAVALLLVWVAVVGHGHGWSGLAAELAAGSVGVSGERGRAKGGFQHQKSSGPTGRMQGGNGSACVTERVVSSIVWLHERTPGIAAVVAAAVCAFAALTTPPARYPFLHDAAFTCVGFLFFVAATIELAVHTWCL